jgi:hypothetical protein
MNTRVSSSRSSLLTRGAIIALLGLSSVRFAAAQDSPASDTATEPSPSARADGPGSAMPEHSAAGAVKLEVDALRAEVNALKDKQAEAESAALLTSGDEDVAHAADAEPLHVYGFMDFGLDKYFLRQGNGLSLLRPTTTSTFVFGNLNLYFQAEPVEHLRTMVELRFTLAPNGEETQLGPPLGTSYRRTDTTVFDYSSPSSQAQLRLGGIYIERAWSEYQFSDLLKLQWGLFLNPFGIWILDHGSPTLISLMLPTFIASQMVPTRLLGVHLYGSAFFGSSELGYALHVTNGRGPLDFDLAEDKAVGARLYFANEADFGRLVLGASGYVGTYLDQEKVITPAGPHLLEWHDTVNYTEEVVGFDVALDVGALRLRSEAVFRWVVYKDGKSEQRLSRDGTIQYLANRVEYATYFIAAYRTPWRVEPYLDVEVSSKAYTLPSWAGSARSSDSDVAVLYLGGGANVELTTHTLLKLQVVWDRAYDRTFTHKTVDLPIVFVRVVNSF